MTQGVTGWRSFSGVGKEEQSLGSVSLNFVVFLKSEIFWKERNQCRYFYLLEIGSNCSGSLLDVQMIQICWQKKISQYPKITVLIFAHEIPCLCSCSSNFKVNTQACSAFVIVTAAEVSVVAKNELQPHHFLPAHWPRACQGETVPQGLLGKWWLCHCAEGTLRCWLRGHRVPPVFFWQSIPQSLMCNLHS